MICPKCGAQLSDSAVICRACGAMLPEHALPSQQPYRPTQQPAGNARAECLRYSAHVRAMRRSA